MLLRWDIMNHLRQILRIIAWCIVDLIIVAVLAIGLLIIHIESELPDVSVLKNVEMQVPLRVYSADHKLIAEFGEKRRFPVPYEQIPPQLIHAVLATEDQRFFEHPGFDFWGLARATVQLVLTGTKSQGGSTITMQVARNFFLSPKKTYTRKLKEILLAMKIEQAFNKQKILDLYLNKIYFGNRAYGVAAAAQAYFGKDLSQLTVPEMAMIAGLPKAPTMLNPSTHPVAAKDRRDHVLTRMYEQKYITEDEYKQYVATPLVTVPYSAPIEMQAPYIAEMVRNAMVAQFGAEDTYTKGYQVTTTIDSHLQDLANTALDNTLLAYDQRHGYRGPVKDLSLTQADPSTWTAALAAVPSVGPLVPAVVTGQTAQSLSLTLADGTVVPVTWDNIAWARKQLGDSFLGPKITSTYDILKRGDVVYTRQLPSGDWQLAQVPEVEGSLVAMNPQDGAILALDGGFSFSQSKFNRTIQAQRQPGSSFKPFIYAAGLSRGFTLATMINDAPFEIALPDGTIWRPQNSDKKFYGPTSLRVALAKSRNVVSIRLLQMTGVRYTIKYLKNFGFPVADIPPNLSMALGTISLTPLELASGYMVFANGGYQVKPYFIEQVVDGDGKVTYQAEPDQACEACITAAPGDTWTDPDSPENTAAIPLPKHVAQQTVSPQIAYLITSALKDTINYGTANKAKSLNRTDLAGKTGTTNETKDAWFAGYNSDLLALAWVGFDQPRSLHEYGAAAALPMWMAFMQGALDGKPLHTMPEPPGLVTMRIDPKTGSAVPDSDPNGITETFIDRTAPAASAGAGSGWKNPDQKDNTTQSDWADPDKNAAIEAPPPDPNTDNGSDDTDAAESLF